MIAVSGSKETSGLGRIRSILSFINDDLGVRHGESLSRQVIMPVADRSGPPSVTLPNRRANVLSAMWHKKCRSAPVDVAWLSAGLDRGKTQKERTDLRRAGQAAYPRDLGN